jgi:hypothetical protein
MARSLLEEVAIRSMGRCGVGQTALCIAHANRRVTPENRVAAHAEVG